MNRVRIHREFEIQELDEGGGLDMKLPVAEETSLSELKICL